MNDYFVGRKYFVYRHVSPNGKMYIGITGKSTPESRWGKGGRHYFKNKHFWHAINKYGWDNFRHIIVAHGLDVVQACNLENYLIRKYNTMHDGYNQTSGGVRPTEVTDDVRYRAGSALRGKTLSAAHRAKLRDARIGVRMSEGTRNKLSMAHKLLWESTRYVWVHRGAEETEIPDVRLTEYLDSGYVLGRSNMKNVYLTRDGETIKISEAELETYLSNGWVRGFADSRCENIKKSKQRFVYSYDGMEFPTGKSLAMYLRNHGYPKIVQGTVNLLCQGKIIQAYPELSTAIVRKSINESI